jgi:chaperonin GroEL
MVAVERVGRPGAPELLDDAGTIARRIVALADQGEDMGAMLVRQMLWKMRNKVGDGAATAAVLFEAVFDRGLTYLAAGGNPMALRRYLEQGLRVVLAELADMARPISGQDQLAQFAFTICHEREMARLLGEIFDIIGEYGSLDVREGRGRELEREYVEGMYWDTQPFSRDMLTPKLRVEMENAVILVSDATDITADDLVPILQATVAAGDHALLIIAQDLKQDALALLMNNNDPQRLQVVAVKTPYVGTRQMGTLRDVALLTGARAVLQAAGDAMAHVRYADLGHARRVWAERDYVGIIGGRGDAKALRRHLAELRATFAAATDAEIRRELRQRIGKLQGGSATLWTGGATESEIEANKELAERTAEALRGAMLEGVVPGGGAALLACRPALHRKLAASDDLDERAAYSILLHALEEPTRVLVANAGCDPSKVFADLAKAGPGYGFEVHTEQVLDMVQAGVLDAASVTRTAFTTAVTTAALALTTDVLVNHKKPVTSYEP